MKIYFYNCLFFIIDAIISKDTLIYIEDTKDKQILNNKLNSETLDITNNQNKTVYDYDFYNINTSILLSLMEIPSESKYRSNNTCVTFPELITHNYTVAFTKFDYSGKIFPENFCYSALTYNISRNDFFNIIEKNKSKIIL